VVDVVAEAVAGGLVEVAGLVVFDDRLAKR
jgi:hypothetical protein